MQQQPMTVNATHAAQAPVQQAQVVSVRTANGQIVQVSKVLRIFKTSMDYCEDPASRYEHLNFPTHLSLQAFLDLCW